MSYINTGTILEIVGIKVLDRNPAKMQDFAWLGDDMNLYDAATESSRSKNSFKMDIRTSDFYVYFFSG